MSPLTALPGLHTLEPSQSPHLVMHLLPWRWQLGGGPQLWVWGECCQHPHWGDTELTRSLLQGLDPKVSWAERLGRWQQRAFMVTPLPELFGKLGKLVLLFTMLPALGKHILRDQD